MSRTEQLQELLSKSPQDDFLLYGLAIEHAKSGDHERAVAYFDRAIEANAQNPYHYYHKARSLEALRRVNEVVATLRAGVDVARKAQDHKAVDELQDYIEMIGINYSRDE